MSCNGRTPLAISTSIYGCATAGGIRAAVLPLSPAELQRRLVRLNTNLRQQAVDARQALVQFATIIVPEGALDADAQVLEIVADGRISNLPFAALPDAG